MSERKAGGKRRQKCRVLLLQVMVPKKVDCSHVSTSTTGAILYTCREK